MAKHYECGFNYLLWELTGATIWTNNLNWHGYWRSGVGLNYDYLLWYSKGRGNGHGYTIVSIQIHSHVHSSPLYYYL